MLRQSHPIHGPYQTDDLVNYFRRGRWYGPARVLSAEGKSSLWLVHSGMTVLISDTCCRPATVEDIKRKQALEMRPAWPSQRGKRKHQDLLDNDLEDLPFSFDAPADDEEQPTQYFDFGGRAPPEEGDQETTVAAQQPAIADGSPTEPDLEMGEEAANERQVTQPEQEPAEAPSTTASAALLPLRRGLETQQRRLKRHSKRHYQQEIRRLLPLRRGHKLRLCRRSVDQVDGVARSRSPSRAPLAPPGLGHLASLPEVRDVFQERKVKNMLQNQKKVHAFLAQRGEKKYRKKVQKQGKGREIVYQQASDDVKKQLDETRRKEWDNWKGYSNMMKITAAEFEKMKRLNPNLRAIATRWVDIDKAEKGQPPKYKSRFVVRGDLEDSSNMRADSPTGSQVGMGLVLSYAAATGKPLHSGDISAAFLQGSVLDRQLVLRMPKGQAPYDMEEDDLIVVSLHDGLRYQGRTQRLVQEPGRQRRQGDCGWTAYDPCR